jgi:hypothetical protein
MNSLRPILVGFGMVLIAVGGTLLLYIAMRIYEFLDNPESIKLMAYLTQYVKPDDKAFHGMAGDQPIDFYMSENLQMIIYSGMGVMLFIGLSGLVVAIVNAGVQMVKVGMNTNDQKNQDRV